MLDLANRRTLIQSLPDDYKIGVEIGVSFGSFSKFMNEAHEFTEFYCVDPWEFNPQLTKNIDLAYQNTLKNLAPFGEKIHIRKAWSPKASEEFEDEYFDFIYIDGDHTYEAVKADMEGWWDKLKVGGIMSGHDYGWPGVRKAVDEFALEYGVKIRATGIVGIGNRVHLGEEFDGDQPSWLIEK